MKRRNSLEARLCLLTIGLLFALLLAVGHVQLNGQRAALIEEKTDRYESLSRMLALIYTPVIEGDDWSIYREFTRKSMQTDKDISYVIISDAEGEVLFAEARDLPPHEYRNFVGKNANRLMSIIGRLGLGDSREPMKIHVPATVKSGERGYITIAFGSSAIEAATEAMETSLLVTFAAAFLAGLFGAILLAKTIVAPIRRLIAAAHTVEAGNLNTTVPVTSTDELGELSASFNRMVIALRDSTDKLIERANTDSLTGLYNHRYFQERLRSELKRAERYGRPLSVIMLDIDHFKTLNDAHGHPVGDAVLHEVAQVLIEQTRSDIDVITRYGGEEFALILPESDAMEAMTVAERIRETIQGHRFTGKESEMIPVTISLGVAQYPVHSSEPEGLVMAADLAMYQSKSMGRNRTSLFNADDVQDKEHDPYRLYLLLHATDIGTIEAMAAAVDTKGQRDPGFSRAVTSHAVAIARELGLGEKEQNDYRIASLLHDIGNLGISETILNREGSLSEEEYAIIRSHTILGHAVVQKSPHLKSMLPGILYHHEWWNGSGYPDGLKGEEIPLIARVIAIVDSYHAMLVDRTYRKSQTPEEAREELRRFAGTQFDPELVEVFLRVLDAESSQSKAA